MHLTQYCAVFMSLLESHIYTNEYCSLQSIHI